MPQVVESRADRACGAPVAPPALRDLRARFRPGYSLEQAFYASQEIYAWDLERVFRRHWLLAGAAARIPRSGDYFTYDLGSDSLIVFRDERGAVRALHNVCRHRGSRLCLAEEGRVQRWTCPYHAWSYDLDGALRTARQLPAEVDPAGLSLHPVQVRVVAGLIFVCLAADPPEFSHTAADVAEHLQPYDLAGTQVCRRTVETIAANWKVVAENFWECAHCPPTHPEFCSVMSYAHAQLNPRLAEERAAFERAWEAAQRAAGRPCGRVARSPRGLHEGGRLPIRPGFLTQSEGGRPVGPLLGSQAEFDGGITSFMHFPLLWYVVCNDYALLTRFTPLAPLQTELELTWLVRGGAVEGRDYDPDRVCWLWQTTAAQDKTICENNQRGILSSKYQPGPYLTTERSVAQFVAWYLDEILVESER